MIIYASYSKLSKKHKNANKIANNLNRSNGSLVIDQNILLTVLIHNLQTGWPTKISMPFLSFLDNLLLDTCIIWRKSVDNFEIAHKTW